MDFIQLGAFETVFVTLKKYDWDTNLYIFSKGDEFWFSMVELPTLLDAIRSNFTIYKFAFERQDRLIIVNHSMLPKNDLAF